MVEFLFVDLAVGQLQDFEQIVYSQAELLEQLEQFEVLALEGYFVHQEQLEKEFLELKFVALEEKLVNYFLIGFVFLALFLIFLKKPQYFEIPDLEYSFVVQKKIKESFDFSPPDHTVQAFH